MRRRLARERGQSLTEYVILMAVIAGMARFLSAQMPALLQRLERPFKNQYARAYKYGRPDACGFEGDPQECGGSPQNHPRYREGPGSHMFGRGP